MQGGNGNPRGWIPVPGLASSLAYLLKCLATLAADLIGPGQFAARISIPMLALPTAKTREKRMQTTAADWLSSAVAALSDARM